MGYKKGDLAVQDSVLMGTSVLLVILVKVGVKLLPYHL